MIYTVDHWRVIRSSKHFRKACDMFLKASNSPGGTDVEVQHEADDKCCRKEPWSDTLSRIMKEVRRDTGGNILQINL